MRTLHWWNGILLCLGTQQLAAQSAVVIVGTSVVDVATGKLLPNRTVLMEGGLVTRVGGPDSVAIPPGVVRVDGTGTFALPGLYDLHVHLQSRSDLELFLANGVTSVQALNAHDGVVRWADSVAAGQLMGPAIHPCIGPISGIEQLDAARETVARAVSRQEVCLKPYDRFSDSAYKALLATARSAGVRTISHIPRNLSWQVMLTARPDAVAHLEEFLYSPITSSEDLDTIVSGLRRNGIAVITTLTNFDLITRQLIGLPELLTDPRLSMISSVISRTWGPGRNRYPRTIPASGLPSMRNLLVFQRRLARMIDSAGGRLLPGTDAGNNFVLPGWSLHDELSQLVASGLTPARVLRAATVDAATFLGDSAGGSIAPGQRADLVLLRGNPLIDISNSTLIAGVVRDGIWFPRDSLRARLARVAGEYASEHRFVADVDARGVTAALAATPRTERPAMLSMNEFGYQYWRLDADTLTARQVFEANADWYPNEWVAHATLAEYFDEVGNRDRARAALGRALALAPTNRELLEMQQRLR